MSVKRAVAVFLSFFVWVGSVHAGPIVGEYVCAIGGGYVFKGSKNSGDDKYLRAMIDVELTKDSIKTMCLSPMCDKTQPLTLPITHKGKVGVVANNGKVHAVLTRETFSITTQRFDVTKGEEEDQVLYVMHAACSHKEKGTERWNNIWF